MAPVLDRLANRFLLLDPCPFTVKLPDVGLDDAGGACSFLGVASPANKFFILEELGLLALKLPGLDPAGEPELCDDLSIEVGLELNDPEYDPIDSLDFLLCSSAGDSYFRSSMCWRCLSIFSSIRPILVTREISSPTPKIWDANLSLPILVVRNSDLSCLLCRSPVRMPVDSLTASSCEYPFSFATLIASICLSRFTLICSALAALTCGSWSSNGLTWFRV